MARDRERLSHDLPEDLLERLAEIARALAEAGGLDETLQRVVDLAEGYLEGCDGASLMLIRRGGELTTPAFSSPIAHRSDKVQHETGEGPCLEAIREHHTVVIDDLETEERWPAYRQGVLGLGIRSMIIFRLFVAEDTMGALNLYGARPSAFDRRSIVLGEVFASHAAVAMKSAIAEAGLEAALRSRDVIGQAKGIIMEREHVTADEAFQRLQRISQRSNRPVRAIAQDVAVSGDVPMEHGPDR